MWVLRNGNRILGCMERGRIEGGLESKQRWWIEPQWRWLAFETKAEALAAKSAFIEEKREHFEWLNDHRKRWGSTDNVLRQLDRIRWEIEQLEAAQPARFRIPRPTLLAFGGRLNGYLWWGNLDEERGVLVPDKLSSDMKRVLFAPPWW